MFKNAGIWISNDISFALHKTIELILPGLSFKCIENIFCDIKFVCPFYLYVNLDGFFYNVIDFFIHFLMIELIEEVIFGDSYFTVIYIL